MGNCQLNRTSCSKQYRKRELPHRKKHPLASFLERCGQMLDGWLAAAGVQLDGNNVEADTTLRQRRSVQVHLRRLADFQLFADVDRFFGQTETSGAAARANLNEHDQLAQRDNQVDFTRATAPVALDNRVAGLLQMRSSPRLAQLAQLQMMCLANAGPPPSCDAKAL